MVMSCPRTPKRARKDCRRDTVCEMVLIKQSPGKYDYLRSRWSSEMLVLQFETAFGVIFMPPRCGVCCPNRNRVARRLCIQDLKKRKIWAIRHALK